MMDTEHTPLPWTLTQRDSIPFTYEVTDAAGVVVLSQDIYAYSSGTRSAADAMDGVGFKFTDMRGDVIAANAKQRARLEIIVHSVNLLPEAMEALREAERQLVYHDEKFGTQTGSGNAVLARIRSILAKATS